MASSTVVDNLLIGTGAAAIAAAMALRRAGLSFQVVDVGQDLEPAREARAAELARSEPATWSQEDRQYLFPPPRTSSKGVEKRLAFGSDFPYRTPAPLEIETENCVIDVSHGFGGFGNVWGAAMLPWTDNDLVRWPIRAADLTPSYRNVAEFVPMSSVSDDLEAAFPRFTEAPALTLSPQGEWLRRVFAKRQVALKKNGVTVGRARTAVDATGGETSCRYCGYCLDGCPYGSIFNPRLAWKRLESQGVEIRRGLFAQEFSELVDGVDVTVQDVQSGVKQVLRTRRVLLAAGALNSTRIVARSLRLERKPIKLLDSQYFFFPFLSYRKHPEAPQFALAELFVEILNPGLGAQYTHFQVYGLNSIFRQTIRAMVPGFLRQPWLLNQVEHRFFLFQGFLHSEVSGFLELTLQACEDNKDRVKIRGTPSPASLRWARLAKRLLARVLLPYGIVPPFYLKMVPLGRSFHIGGSFPMGGRDAIFRADRQGRPAGLKRVHLLDASTFPSIPATTITFTIMANSDRIIGEMAAGIPS